jgi:hypothetical protein
MPLAYGSILGSNGPTLYKFELDHLGGLSFHSPIHAGPSPYSSKRKEKKLLPFPKMLPNAQKLKRRCY